MPTLLHARCSALLAAAALLAPIARPSAARAQTAAAFVKKSGCMLDSIFTSGPPSWDDLFDGARSDRCNRDVRIYSSDGKLDEAFPIDGTWKILRFVRGERRVALVGGAQNDALVVPFDQIADVLVGKETLPVADCFRCDTTYGALSVVLKAPRRPRASMAAAPRSGGSGGAAPPPSSGPSSVDARTRRLGKRH